MKKLIPLIFALAMLLLAAGCGGTKTVTVSDDGVENTAVEVKSGASVQEILQEAQITIGEKDEVTPALTDKPQDGEIVEIKRYAQVNIVTDTATKTVELVGGTVEDALKEAGITVAEDESLNVEKDAKLSTLDGDIVIAKMLTVKLTADGKTEEFSTPVVTVKEFLAAQGVEYTETDRLSPTENEKLTQGLEIVLQRVEEKTETVKENIPFDTEKETDASLDKGTTKTKREGVNGEKEVTYKITLVDGEEESREVTDEKVLKEAVNAVVLVGGKEEAETGANGKVIVSKVAVPDCDGSGHGYYVITYADGTEDYEDY